MKGMIILNERNKNIFVRVTTQEKNHIDRSAQSCGLSMSEYLRKRALCYFPQAMLSDEFHLFHAKLCELCNAVDGKVSTETEDKLLRLVDDIRSALLLPGKGE